jgi:hypothetical protein
MKKVFILLGCIFMIVPLFCRERSFYTALGLGIQYKSDQYFKEVYDNGIAAYTLDAGYWFDKNMGVGIKASCLKKTGETSLMKAKTDLKQTPVFGYFKVGMRLGKSLLGYASAGLGCLFFKEVSYIGRVTDTQFGWEAESGLEYSFKKRFYLLGAANYQSFKKNFVELHETQQLGGLTFRLGIGIRF